RIMRKPSHRWNRPPPSPLPMVEKRLKRSACFGATTARARPRSAGLADLRFDQIGERALSGRTNVLPVNDAGYYLFRIAAQFVITWMVLGAEASLLTARKRPVAGSTV